MNRLEAIGVGGTMSSGKDTLAEYLVDTRGWRHISTGDIVRQEFIRQELVYDRVALQDFADQLRLDHGPGVLGGIAVEMYMERRAPKTGLVVSGLRTPEEFEEIKYYLPDSLFVYMDAPRSERFTRLKHRGRIGDEETFDRFKANEKRELKSVDRHHINHEAVRDHADIHIWNNGRLVDLYEAIDERITA